MKTLTVILSSLSMTLFLTSCYYDNFEKLHPEGALPIPCDSVGVISYSAQIVPILQNSCTQNCHNGVGTGSRDLTDYNQVQAATQNGVYLNDGGSLYGTVNWDPNYGNNMPKDGSKLSDCDIAKIRKWAVAGGPNN